VSSASSSPSWLSRDVLPLPFSHPGLISTPQQLPSRARHQSVLKCVCNNGYCQEVSGQPRHTERTACSHTHTHTHTHTFVSLSLMLCCVAAVLPVDQRLTVKKIRSDPPLDQAPPPDGQELACTASSSSASRQRQRDGKSSRRQSGKEQTADDEDDEPWLSGMFRLRVRQRRSPDQ
jgi:hypothetical protein